MVKNLIVPKKYAKKEKVEEKVEDKKSELQVSDAYVKEENRVLDPNLLKKSTKQRMPQPTGYRIVVMPFQGFAKSKGGILLSDETRERESLATVVAYIVQLGPDAYKDKSKFPSGPYCKQGDWAIIGKYAGTRIKLEDGEIRILNDDEILGTILEPTDVYTI
mgnify:FL=1|jgi:chaperonin GroES|tara:strand:+ start:215 stop:700 length:486 start_codon:yes stop_codon:yes gene_type:complete